MNQRIFPGLIMLIGILAGTARLQGQPTTQPVATSQPLQSTILQAGTPGVQKGDTVWVYYTGKLSDGTVFDSSATQGGRAYRFRVGDGAVIKGWDEGVVGMQVGEKRQLVIPPWLAYGEKGHAPQIPANSTLTFEIELLGFVRIPTAAK